MNITRQKGCKDILPDESILWQYIEKEIKEICRVHNIQEIRTPVFEATELYARGVGDETDIVTKEMYTFLDKGNRSIVLSHDITFDKLVFFFLGGILDFFGRYSTFPIIFISWRFSISQIKESLVIDNALLIPDKIGDSTDFFILNHWALASNKFFFGNQGTINKHIAVPC